jgi:putative spermidine/putrescine transport system permease protein
VRFLGWLAFACFLLYVVSVMIAPIIYSFSTVWQGILPQGFTLEWYRRVLSSPAYLPSVELSLMIATLAVIINLVAGIPTVYAAYRMRGRFGDQVRRFLQILPLVVPPLVVGLGFLLAFNHPPLVLAGTVWIVVFGHAALGFPFFFRTVYAGIASIGIQPLLEAAAASGAGLWARLRYVLLPNLLPSLLSGSLVVFAISMGEFEITSMVAGFGTITMPLLLFQSLRENFQVASTVSALLLYTTLLALGGLTVVRRQ